MHHLRLVIWVSLVFLALSDSFSQSSELLKDPREHHLKNIRQLTFGGENAEAYFSFDQQRLIFQSTRDSLQCDQIFTMTTSGDEVRMLSTGKGRTTCAYFLPGDTTFLFSSTHLRDPKCPQRPDYSKGYVWAIYPSYDIFLASTTTGILKQLTTTEGYDAEATVSPRGDRIVFTSVRDGDLDLYSMNLDGSGVKRLTHEVGYDGGAFYSFDGAHIVYRGYHPSDKHEIEDYTTLLKAGIVRPSKMEIYVMDSDGRNKRQLTNFGAASFAPYFHPDGKRIIFASNKNDPKGRNFDLFLIDTDGSHLEQVTFNETFDGFPMFNNKGTWIVFASNRQGGKQGETNIFMAEWEY